MPLAVFVSKVNSFVDSLSCVEDDSVCAFESIKVGVGDVCVSKSKDGSSDGLAADYGSSFNSMI